MLFGSGMAATTAVFGALEPGDPLWTITDIAGAAAIAHAAGARLGIDSTAASPIHTRPLSRFALACQCEPA